MCTYVPLLVHIAFRDVINYLVTVGCRVVLYIGKARWEEKTFCKIVTHRFDYKKKNTSE